MPIFQMYETRTDYWNVCVCMCVFVCVCVCALVLFCKNEWQPLMLLGKMTHEKFEFLKFFIIFIIFIIKISSCFSATFTHLTLFSSFFHSFLRNFCTVRFVSKHASRQISFLPLPAASSYNQIAYTIRAMASKK